MKTIMMSSRAPPTTLTLFSLLLLFAGIGAVRAHFQMIYPPATRGFDESKEPLAPCGGFDVPVNDNDRLSMPRSSFMTIDSGHVSYSYVIKALYSDQPTADDFTAASLRQLTDGTRTYPQAACLPFEFGGDVQDGTKATLQIVYNGGDGLLYQCIDVIVDNTASLNASMCYNTHGAPPPNRTPPAAEGEKEADATSESTTTSSQGSSITAAASSAYGVLMFMAIGIISIVVF
ncbi:hypothetical protein MBANPS3_000974 [Mucor bainieri]